MSKSQASNKSDGMKNFDSSKGGGHVELSEIGSGRDSDSEKKSKQKDTRKHGKMASIALNDV